MHTLLYFAYSQSQISPRLQRIESSFQVRSVTDLAILVQAVGEDEADCVLVSGSVPDYTRMEILDIIRATKPVPVIFQDCEMTVAEAARLARNGAHNCFGEIADEDSQEVFLQSLQSACEERKRRQRRRSTTNSNQNLNRWLVGESRAMEEVLSTIGLIGPRRCTVLITGETGTGKEMAARALHAASPRAHLPMVAVNCSALPENLLEAELFGHVKGAFTGATNHRVGRFEQAHKSTIFLDEIGEMPLELQAKLLRVLQEREIQRLGSSETIHVDVRVVAASNADLPERVKQGKFREDLYYRLNVVPLRTPPLRNRVSDIPLLVHHFVEKVCRMEAIETKEVSPEAMKQLVEFSWPGNVRQLENRVEMAIALSGDHEMLMPAHFGMGRPAPVARIAMSLPQVSFSESLNFESMVSQFEHSILRQALHQTGGNKTAAADLLGLKRTTLIMKLRYMNDSAELMQQAS